MRDPLDLVARRGTEVAVFPAVDHRIRDETMVDDDGREVRMAEVVRVHEHELVDDGHLGDERRERRPPDEPVTPEPVDPGRPPDGSRHPHPPDRRVEPPTPVVERPRPRLRRDPGPAIGRPAPVSVDVWSPSVSDRRPPDLPVGRVVNPLAVGVERVLVASRQGFRCRVRLVGSVLPGLLGGIVGEVLLGADRGRPEDQGDGEKPTREDTHGGVNTRSARGLRYGNAPSSITCSPARRPSGRPSTKRDGFPSTMPVARS